MTNEHVYILLIGLFISFYAIKSLVEFIKLWRRGNKELDSIIMNSLIVLGGSSMIMVVFTWVISTTYVSGFIVAECNYDDGKKGIQCELDGKYYTLCAPNPYELDSVIGKTVNIKVNGISPELYCGYYAARFEKLRQK